VSKPFEDIGSRISAFGERLRRERELRGISLDEISAVTKIGTRLLRALEEGQLDLLPGGIFNKGYVRAYARHLGIDEEQAVADYLKAADETPPDVRLIAHQNASARADHISSSVFYRGSFPVIPVLILLVVIVGAAGGWHLYQQRQRETQPRARVGGVAAGQPSSTSQMPSLSPGGNAASGQTGSVAPPSISTASPNSTASTHAAVGTVEAAESSPRPAGPNPYPPASRSAGPEGEAPFEITVRAKDRAWVEIKSDGKVLLRGVMNPTDVKTIHATSRVVFWTGNAGVVELSFNGKNIPLNGGENDEQVLVFNSHGLVPRPAAQ
jgi:cytoskeleton protein RodZ